MNAKGRQGTTAGTQKQAMVCGCIMYVERRTVLPSEAELQKAVRADEVAHGKIISQPHRYHIRYHSLYFATVGISQVNPYKSLPQDSL